MTRIAEGCGADLADGREGVADVRTGRTGSRAGGLSESLGGAAGRDDSLAKELPDVRSYEDPLDGWRESSYVVVRAFAAVHLAQ